MVCLNIKKSNSEKYKVNEITMDKVMIVDIIQIRISRNSFITFIYFIN